MSEGKVWACRAGDIFDDSASVALFKEYERECANPLLPMTAPKREQYEAIEATGFAFCFEARHKGELCGFACYVMGNPLHYGGLPCATVESLFVSDAARASSLGGLLIDAVERDAKNNGCVVIFYHAPVSSRLARLLFLSEDQYRHTGHVFSRRLG